MDTAPWRLTQCPDRSYRTVPRPRQMRHGTNWPIPAPEVIRAALETPLRGLWIDHVPNGAELAAMDLLYTDKLEQAQASPLATGDWESFPYAIWMSPHPEELTPQTTMPEPWFNHAEARQPPAALEDYEPAHGRTVRTVVGSSLSGSGAKEEAHKLPALWRRGLLTSAEERSLANHLLRNASAVQWYQIMLDEQWTVRHAAEVLREAGITNGDICQLTNAWAKPPPGTPPAESAKAEDPREIEERCMRQLTDAGDWPLSRTVEIARSRGYERIK